MGSRVAVTGSTGLIGQKLCDHLTARGDEVVRLRHTGNPHDPLRTDEQLPLSQALKSVDAVVNLAGAPLASRRLTHRYLDEVRTSRVRVTEALIHGMSRLDRPVRLVSGSASGIYGDAGDAVLSDDAPRQRGKIPDVVAEWEDSALQAEADGHSVALARTSIVLSPQGGALERLLPLAKVSVNGPLGHGRQWWSWISLADEIRALAHLLDHPEVTGAVNLSAPRAVRQLEFAQSLGRSVRRPAVAPAPAPLLRVVLGEFACELLQSRRMSPDALTNSGFEWSEPNLDQVLDRASH